MTKKTFTPGPWYAEKSSDNFWYITTSPYAFAPAVASTWAAAWDKEGTPFDQEANARLLSAAPDLLACLRELVALVRGECPRLLADDSGGNGDLDQQIDTVIAQAEGRQ
jgi:hypothetical protein